MRTFWIRHGQMDLRVSRSLDRALIDRVFNQEQESGLSERGRREAARVAARLAGAGIDAVYGSALIRAKQTAEIVASALGMEPRVHAGIGEVRTGRLRDDARSARFVERVAHAPLPASARVAVLGSILVPLYYQAWRREWTVGGESPAELDARVHAFIEHLRATHPPDARIAIVSHGYLMFTLARAIARGPRDRLRLLRRPYIANGAITEIDVGEELRLISFAEDAHLRG